MVLTGVGVLPEPLLHEAYISKDALCDRDSDVLKPFGEESFYLKTVLTVR